MCYIRLKELCKEKGISIANIAESSGIPQPNLSKIANAKTSPTVDTLQKIATALDVELWELFTPSTEKGEFMALIKNGSTFRYATSFDELKGIVADMEQVSQG